MHAPFRNLARYRTPSALALAVLLCACSRPAANDNAPLQIWPLPAASQSFAPSISTRYNGDILVSWHWQQPQGRTAFMLAEYNTEKQWSPAKTIAVGSRFHIDTQQPPQVHATPDGVLWALWLQKIDANNPQAYHISASTSRDAGVHWSSPLRVHLSDSQHPHGFTTLWSADSQSLGLAWLQQNAEDASFQLRSNTALHEETPIADAVLPCSSSASVDANRLPLLLYRNNEALQLQRQQNNQWQVLHTIATEPVGTATDTTATICEQARARLASNGQHIAITWLHNQGTHPRLQLTQSHDNGQTFTPAITLAEGAQLLGRPALALDATHLWVLWVEQHGNQQQLWLARYHQTSGEKTLQQQIAHLDNADMGLPQLAARDNRAYIVWTDQVNGKSQVRGLYFSAPAAP